MSEGTRLGDITIEQLGQFANGLAVGLVVMVLVLYVVVLLVPWLWDRIRDGFDRYRY